jgi:imidazolonepropionase
MSTSVLLAGRVVTCDPVRGSAGNELGVVVDGGLLIEGAAITFVGGREDVLRAAGGAAVVLDAPDAVITPGLCDAHTHAVYVGSRHDEYVQRLAGASYEDIARAGGGIVASMRAVRAASRSDLVSATRDRLSRMASLGVTTVEVKSGYGLDPANECKQLEAIAELSHDPSLPRLVPTYLALHALPPEMRVAPGAYVARAIDEVGALAADGLIRFVDAYVDRGAFSTADAEALALAAQKANVGVRLHAGQFADVGAAALAARVGAASADHLEHVTVDDLEALARAGTRAVLLPVASFTLGQSPPPVALMRAVGIGMVVASDANPGTAPTESLPLALAFGVRNYGLTADEALRGATREAAFSLSLGAVTGALAPGLAADLVVWDLRHEHAIIEPWGVSKARLVLREGRAIGGEAMAATMQTPRP